MKWNSEIGFAQLGLANVLKQYNLAVPPNQREYAWTEKEVGALFKDLNREIAAKDPSYFLGTIVAIPRSPGFLGSSRRPATIGHSHNSAISYQESFERNQLRNVSVNPDRFSVCV